MDETSGVSVERQIELRASPEEIWHFLTSGDVLSLWMDGVVEIDLRPGGRITLDNDGSDQVWGTVEEIVEAERIQWSWRTDDGLPTLVEIEIEQSEAGTALTIRETLLPWKVSGPDEVVVDQNNGPLLSQLSVAA